MIKIMRITKKSNVKLLDEEKIEPKAGDILVNVNENGDTRVLATWCKRNKSDQLDWN